MTRPIDALDVPLPVLERQLAELRAHALKHLRERGMHDFLDLNPQPHGRDNTRQETTNA